MRYLFLICWVFLLPFRAAAWEVIASGLGDIQPEWEIEDDFSTDTTAAYTAIMQISEAVHWDETNGRLTGENEAYWSSSVYHNTPLGSADQEVIATLINTGAESVTTHSSRLIFRCSGTGASSTGWAVGMDSGALQLYSFSGTTVTNITYFAYSGGKTWAQNASYAVRVVAVGTGLSLYVDWNADGDFTDTDETVTNNYTIATTPTGTYVGLMFIQAGEVIWADNLRAK